MPTIENMPKTMEDALRRDQQNKVEVIYDSLVEHPPKARLPEEIFVNYFLPFFAGTAQITPDRPYYAQWISVAGTAMNEVDIFDVTGQVLFTVPALLNTMFIHPERGQRPFGNIMKEYDMRLANPAAMANKFLDETLDARMMEAIEPLKKEDLNTDRWTQIFARYGIAVPSGVKSLPGPAVNEPDDLIY